MEATRLMVAREKETPTLPCLNGQRKDEQCCSHVQPRTRVLLELLRQDATTAGEPAFGDVSGHRYSVVGRVLFCRGRPRGRLDITPEGWVLTTFDETPLVVEGSTIRSVVGQWLAAGGAR